MNLFSVVFERALTSKGLDRSAFSKATEIGLPTLSKYITGKAFPKPPALERIMNELSQEEASEVFKAYLREVFGAETLKKVDSSLQIRDLIKDDSVSYSATRKTSAKSETISKKNEELDYCLLLLRELAQQRPEVADMLKAILQAFNPPSEP